MSGDLKYPFWINQNHKIPLKSFQKSKQNLNIAQFVCRILGPIRPLPSQTRQAILVGLKIEVFGRPATRHAPRIYMRQATALVNTKYVKMIPNTAPIGLQ